MIKCTWMSCFVLFALCSFGASPLAAQPGACGAQPITPCATYQCVNGTWKVSFHAGACTVDGQNGACALYGWPPNQTFYCAGPNTIHAVVSGLSSGNTLVLGEASNVSGRLSVSANGSFVLPIRPLNGESYRVTVLTQPAGQSCAVGSNGSGTMNGASVTVPVMCLSPSGWTPIGPAPVANPGPGQGGNAGRVNVAVADPTNPAVIYLGTAGGGVWKTSNAAPGMTTPTWQPLTDNIPAPAAMPSDQASLQLGYPHSVSVHPANHDLIQAAVYYSGAGVLLSSQAGAPGSWSLMGNSLFDHHGMSAIAVHPANTQLAYVATDMGLYETINGGQTWTPVTGLPTTGVSDVIFARFDPTGSTLFVSVFGNSGTASNLNGVYRSTNGGATWTLLNTLPNAALSGQYTDSNGLETVNGAIQTDSGTTGAIYVAMLTVGSNPSQPGTLAITAIQRFKSLDRGTTWNPLSPSHGGLETRSWHLLIAVDPQNDNHVFVNDSYALYQSADGGNTWAQPPGSPGFDWTAVTFDANRKVLATADQGLFRYDPTAQTWDSLIGNPQITAFYTITPNSQAIAGTAQDQYGAMIDNSGQPRAVWQYLGAGGETGKVLLPPAGANYAYVYNPLSDDNNDLVWRTQITPQTPLQPSTQWTPIFAKNIYGKNSGNYTFAYTSQKAFVMDPYNARRLLVGADQVYETTDADYASPSPTWNPIGPPAPAGEQPYVTAIAIAPSDPIYIYVATSDQHVWVTLNDGRTWTENDDGLYNVAGGAVLAMSIDPNNPQHVFAVSSNWWGTSKVWELGPPSASGQQTWLNRSGPNNLTAYAIVVDWQYSPVHLFIGTDRGVYNSVNFGTSWAPFGSGLPNAQVFDLQSATWTASPATSVLAAATYGRGAFEILLTEPEPPPTPRALPRGNIPPAPKWIPPMRPPWGEGQQGGLPARLPAPPPKP